MRAGAIARDVAGLGRVGDQRADAGIDLREPGTDRLRASLAHASRQAAGERIVPAGVQEHEAGPGTVLEQLQDIAESTA